MRPPEHDGQAAAQARLKTGGSASMSSRPAGRRLAVLGLVLAVSAAATLLMASPAFAASAQTWATLDAPPSGIVPPGDVLRAGHLGREIGDTQNIIHFYADL